MPSSGEPFGPVATAGSNTTPVLFCNARSMPTFTTPFGSAFPLAGAVVLLVDFELLEQAVTASATATDSATSARRFRDVMLTYFPPKVIPM